MTELCNHKSFFHNVTQRDKQTAHFDFFISLSVLQNINPQEFSHENVFI